MFIYHHIKPFVYTFIGAFIGILLFAGVVYQYLNYQEPNVVSDDSLPVDEELSNLNYPKDRGAAWQELDLPISTKAGEEYTKHLQNVLLSTENVGFRLRDEVLPTMRNLQEVATSGNFTGIYGKIKEARALIASVRLDMDNTISLVDAFEAYNTTAEGYYSEEIKQKTDSLLSESKALLVDIGFILESLDNALTGAAPSQEELNRIDSLGAAIESRSAKMTEEIDELLVLLLDL